MGNRLTSADVSGTWNYNPNNELLGYADVEYEYDENGNLTQIPVAGSVVWTYVYIDVATIANNLRFLEQYENAETGLHYISFRIAITGIGIIIQGLGGIYGLIR